jgi:hypothetical protein
MWFAVGLLVPANQEMVANSPAALSDKTTVH